MFCLVLLLLTGRTKAIESTFTNPISHGADPWVIRDAANNRYLWCFAQGNQVVVYAGTQLTKLGARHVVWKAPATGPYSKEIWAPELHAWGDRWVIYVAASDGQNVNHLSYALCSKSSDPLGDYELKGPLATGEGKDGDSPPLWAIDLTLCKHKNKTYAIWSGWPRPGADHQFLYIRRMNSATELVGPRVKICANDDYPWERTMPGAQGRGLNEGPQLLVFKDRTFLLYSCGASWLPSYRLGLLELIGDDPMLPSSWKKHPQPVFDSTADTWGVGHSSFVKSPDGSQWWHVYHAKQSREPGWPRDVMMQPFAFDRSGFPQFGQPIKRGLPQPLPAGQK